MFTRELAKSELKKKGWSNRAAAARLGRSYQHLNQVLNGHRQSKRLLRAVLAMPTREGGR